MDPLWTLPTSRCIKWSEPSTKGEHMICSLKYIPVLTRFGPYRGALINTNKGYQIGDSLSQDPLWTLPTSLCIKWSEPSTPGEYMISSSNEIPSLTRFGRSSGAVIKKTQRYHIGDSLSQDPLWTLPTSLCIKWSEPSTTGEYMISSSKYISALTRFGPYRGVVIKKTKRYHIGDSLSQMGKESIPSNTIDGMQPSWLRYVKCTSKKEEGNLIAVETSSGFYYVASKPISANKELTVWYPNTIHQEREGCPKTVLENFEVNTGKGVFYHTNEHTEINSCACNQNRHVRALHDNGIEFPEDTLTEKSLHLQHDQFFYKYKPTSNEVKISTITTRGCSEHSPNNEGGGQSQTSFQKNKNAERNLEKNAAHELYSSRREKNTSLREENPNPNLISKAELATESILNRNLKNVWSMREMNASKVTTMNEKENNEWEESEKNTTVIHRGIGPCNLNISGNMLPESVKKNKRIQAGEAPKIYKECMEGFNVNGKLKHPSTVQKGGKQYERKMQARKLRANSTLKNQKIMYIEESDYKSPTCRERNKWNKLNSYKTVHTGENTYGSKNCGKPLTQNRQCHNSSQTAENPYICNVARKEFIRESPQILHESVHRTESVIECEMFSRKFSHISETKPHNAKHICESSFKCDVCRMVFKRKSTLVSQERVQTGDKPYECQTYSRMLSCKGSLKGHNVIHREEKPQECKTSSRKFSHIGNLKKHNMVYTGERPYDCKTCTRKYSQLSNLKTHNSIHTGERPYQCMTCYRKFSQRSDLKKHNMIHTGEKPYECKTCSRSFSRRGDLKRHNLIHTGEKPFQCKSCNRNFARMSSLKTHNLIHNGERPYECTTCSTKFSQRGDLKRHNLVHTGEKRYECKNCSRKFSQLSNLMTHNLIHTGERPYECTTCSTKFSRRGDLKRHNLTHTGEKPYECKTCSRKFSHIGNLKKHNMVHTGERPYECKTCSRKFSRMSNLKTHNSIHSGERPYQCMNCSRKFSQRGHLKRHNLIHSGEKP